MNEFIAIVIKGIVVGLCISVPLGPIGMLCVQRTLHRGRVHGIVTGLGASTSDLFYTFISLFFLSFVLDFIAKNQFLIQILGSVVVCAFGVFIFRSKPSKPAKSSTVVGLPAVKSKNSFVRDYVSAFCLTLSNPLILFVLIALFARFNFLSDQSTMLQIVVGMLSIMVGATAWWATLTLIVSHFRYKCALRELKIINRITGCIIVLIGAVGFLAGLLH